MSDSTGRRRPLSNPGGEVRSGGDPALTATLRRALQAGTVERGEGGAFDPDGLTHGFHSYPARMHRGVAAVLVAEFSRGRQLVLDPFCGGGTVVIEATVASRRALGVDLSPLAVRLAEVKLDLRGERVRRRFLATLAQVAERSEERVRARVPVRARLPRSELGWYGVHTLKELAGLFEEIRSVEDLRDRRALEMVFSANLVKLSLQRADTSPEKVEKRLRKGLPTEHFLRKGRELAARWAALAEATPRDSPKPRVRLGDALHLERALARLSPPDLVLGSPPYGGTHDYVAHHARRYPWLGIDSRPLAQGELGARRNLDGPGALARWDRELSALLASIASVRAPGAPIVLLVGDAQLGGRRVPADAQLRRLAPAAGLSLVAHASQSRRDWLGGPPRREHLVVLR